MRKRRDEKEREEKEREQLLRGKPAEQEGTSVSDLTFVSSPYTASSFVKIHPSPITGTKDIWILLSYLSLQDRSLP
jgi:hypothetical protein